MGEKLVHLNLQNREDYLNDTRPAVPLFATNSSTQSDSYIYTNNLNLNDSEDDKSSFTTYAIPIQEYTLNDGLVRRFDHVQQIWYPSIAEELSKKFNEDRKLWGDGKCV